MPHVLIVDDSPLNLALLSKLTSRIDPDICIQTFERADAALSWLGDHSPDLIIVDYNMPGLNGVAFTRICRDGMVGKGVPIVMVTAARKRHVCLEAMRAGATEFLNTPVKDSDFIERIGDLLKTHRQTTGVEARTQEITRIRNWSREHGFLPGTPDWLKLVHVLDHVPVMISAISPTGQCLFINAMQAAFFNCDPAEITGKDLNQLPDRVRAFFASDGRRNGERIDTNSGQCEYPYIDETGANHVLLTTRKPLFDREGHLIATLRTAVDITDRKRAEQNLLHVAEHDSLTELPNRLSLRKQIQDRIDGAASDGTGFSLLFVDIDRFKGINDTRGHEFGDRLLFTIAGRLDDYASEPNFVARVGGDEFAVLIAERSNQKSGQHHAKALCDIINTPLHIGEEEVSVSASIGVAQFPDHGQSPDELLSQADLAMYKAKADGGNGFEFASPGDHERACRTASLEADLRRAIALDQLRLFYQPKIRLQDRKIIGAEALIRWQHPERGLVSPADFLPIAEQSGLIVPIGEWVVHRACRDANRWIASGHNDLTVSVNISPVQFLKQNVTELTSRALQDADISPSHLIVELTEQSLMRNTQAVRRDLERLRDLGVRISLDDFGTGYASLNYVQNFPISELKIDRSFVKNLTHHRNDLAIVKTIIGLGKTLHLDVVAEGVETAGDALLLAREGCQYAQGYYFKAPVPVADFEALLEGRDEKPLATRAQYA